jgi:hypothetical protein
MTRRSGMARQHRGLLRPGNATSLAEFQARRTAEVERLSNAAFWKSVLSALLSAVLAFIDIIIWFFFAHASGPGRWVELVVGVFVALLALRYLGRSPTRAGPPATAREKELDRIAEEWQAKTVRGEIPRTTPGGVTVWQRELTSDPRSTKPGPG